MESRELKKYQLPDGPGVYFFKQGRRILYVGKATSLKDRVRSYFAGDLGETRGPKIERMLELANRVDWQTTDSVLEALLLESALIKKHQPPYNTREKDDKSYWFVVITHEPFPRVLLCRGRQLSNGSFSLALKIKKIFGPFPRSSEIKAALLVIRKIFPYRDRCQLAVAGRPCFNRQLGLCPGVCTGEINQTDYRRLIANIERLFAGRKRELLVRLERAMKRAARTQRFEAAGQIRNQIFALKHIQDLALLKSSPNRLKGKSVRIEAYDVAHWQGEAAVGAMAVWQDGELDRSQFRQFKLRATTPGDDLAGLREILTRRLGHREWPEPSLVVVDGDQRQVATAQVALARQGLDWPVVGVTKDRHHRAVALAGNLEAESFDRQAVIEVNDAAHRVAIAHHRRRLRLGR
ncbi:MAG: hypothetical protein COV08_01060 [Candidatus Vogelbacteria bacterium CG10_big_fil_rev_8_21_14_0_10_49_38]|uniref:Excinuclease ABC subunit C n=1 Tax=Candidatus Vogelbacteria bacterium CG10_big_fil_rev_8_21_14_0_10_49_38 TaxID=1975043 RepID=A0A2H0RI74_9BACT|nr:MAG: hypothetical protein BK006_01070 [bacterium CG10_49_38]PIR46193.1 MAG: hypothetical protein COV08_01060 [Candidatus Vogelbacteria bacterium CG10_big_fil_rev_8_21_14_0_10_49_38]